MSYFVSNRTESDRYKTLYENYKSANGLTDEQVRHLLERTKVLMDQWTGSDKDTEGYPQPAPTLESSIPTYSEMLEWINSNSTRSYEQRVSGVWQQTAAIRLEKFREVARRLADSGDLV